MLWVCGHPGVGKSTTTWEVVNLLNDRGELSAYVDIDQLKMLHPEPISDPNSERLAATVLRAVAVE